MSSARILVAEDDKNIRIGLVDTLESEGYKVVAAADGVEALALFSQGGLDLVVLDIMMPRKSGYDVCREIRAKDLNIPIIILTAKGEEIDKVVGLQLGADDYVTKPFGVHELLARIAAVLRRSRRPEEKPANKRKKGPACFRFGQAEIDTRQYKARLGRKVFDLSAREVELLQFFKVHQGEVLSRDELLNEIWSINYYGTTRTLDQHIAQLRKKVDLRSASGSCIATIHGVGYKYEET
jgi:DNA-binding response OmpR family regulator